MISKEDAIRIASELALPETVKRLANGEILEPGLNLYWRHPEEFFQLPENVQQEYGQGEIVPLWDNGSVGYLAGVHLPTGKFAEFYIEEDYFAENIKLWNYQQILLENFNRICESEDENELRRQADLFDFKYAAELIAFKQREFKNWDEYDKAFEEFRNNLV